MEQVIEVVRALEFGVGGALLGLLVQSYAKFRCLLPPQARNMRRVLPPHIILLAVSYMLLVVVTMGTQLEALVRDHTLSFRIFVVPFAYFAGFAGFLTLLRQLRG